VIAYLMKEKGKSREEATLLVKQKRKFIHINETFWKELQVWSDQLAQHKK